MSLHYVCFNVNIQFLNEIVHLRSGDVLCETEKKEMTGLAMGVASMKSGERALLHIGWELGYGKDGNFSFPNVPPMADLLYEVEVIGFDETKEASFFFFFF